MGKSTQAPPAPNYAASAQQQADQNLLTTHQNAVLNNPNINTPYGSQTVTWDGQWQPTINQTLTPAGNATVDQQQQADLGLATLANQQTGSIGNLLNQPFSFGGTPQTQVDSAGPINNWSAGQNNFQAQGGVNAPNLQMGLNNYGQANGGLTGGQYGSASGVGGAPQLQGQIDTSGVAKAPVNAGTTAQQAILSRLQPQIQQNRTSTETQLVNQGLRPGSEAYDNAERNLGQQENDQYTQAALQGLNLDMSANQQGFNQAAQSGEFANNAALGGYNAGLAGQQLGNQAIGQNFSQGLAAQGAQNAAQGQNFNQMAQSGQFGNNAQLASFGAGLQNQQAQNSAGQQNFQNTLDQQQAYNQAQQQWYNQNLQNAQFGNTAQAQQLAQQLQLRNLPINQITALLSGSQVQNPQFQPYSQQTAQAAPVFQGAQLQDAYNQNLYNQQVAQSNSGLGGLFGLGGAILGGPIGGAIGKGIGGLFQNA